MKTLISDNQFELIRASFKTQDPILIKDRLMPLIDIISNSNYLEGKLRFHPLGFIYGKLHEFLNSENIRIHIWNSNSKVQVPIMNIHNHFYDVNSFVFRGSVSNDLYKINEETEPTHSIYSGSYKNESTRILTKTESNKNIVFEKRQIILKNNLYSIKKNEIHSGDNINNEITITFVFSENPGNPIPLVFGPLKGEKSYIFHSNLVDQKTINEIKYQIAST